MCNYEDTSAVLIPREDEPEGDAFASYVAVRALSELATLDGRNWLHRSGRPENAETLQLLIELCKQGVDPAVFDALLSNEIDRRLKLRFGVCFVVLTALFSAASYSVIILNGAYSLGISSAAITALIVETPLQFIGLLYIIARNLFPETSKAPRRTANGRRETHKGKGRTAST